MIKVGKKIFPNTPSGVENAKSYSRLTDQGIKSVSPSLRGLSKNLGKFAQVKSLATDSNKNSAEKFRPGGFNSGVDQRGGDTSKHSKLPRFKKG